MENGKKKTGSLRKALYISAVAAALVAGILSGIMAAQCTAYQNRLLDLAVPADSSAEGETDAGTVDQLLQQLTRGNYNRYLVAGAIRAAGPTVLCVAAAVIAASLYWSLKMKRQLDHLRSACDSVAEGNPETDLDSSGAGELAFVFETLDILDGILYREEQALNEETGKRRILDTSIERDLQPTLTEIRKDSSQLAERTAELGGEEQRLAEGIAEAADRSAETAALARNLLNVDEVDLKPGPCKIREFFQLRQAEYREAFESHGLKFIYRGNLPPRAYLDEKRYLQMLDRAVLQMWRTAKTQAVMEVRAAKGVLTVILTCDGPSFEETDHRENNVLNLAVCKAMCRRMGGDLRRGSREGSQRLILTVQSRP